MLSIEYNAPLRETVAADLCKLVRLKRHSLYFFHIAQDGLTFNFVLDVTPAPFTELLVTELRQCEATVVL